MPNGDAPVAIVGAGPVGLTAALALTRHGVPVTVLEAGAELATDMRASTFHPPTLDLLERFGVVEALIGEGLVAPTWQYRDRKEGPVATFDMGVLRNDTAHPYRLQCEQWKLTRRLAAELARRGVPVRFGARVGAVEPSEEGVALTLADGERIEAAWCVAADGAHSPARKAAGIEFEGFTYPELFLVASTEVRFEDELPDLASIAYIADPDEWLVLLRTRTLWRVLIPIPTVEDGEEALSDGFIEGRLQGVRPRPAPYPVEHKTLYHVHQKVAQTFRKGRLLLAGDAAHINNPLGGMGMNGGIHDAFNLADKLAAVWRGADHALLDRYDRQRRTVSIEAVQGQTIRNHKLLSERDPAVRRRSLDELRRTAEDPVKAREFLLRSSMIASLERAEAIP